MPHDQEVLKHRQRKMIFNYISEHPGTTLPAIRRVFDLNPSTLKYHLHYLEKNRKIVIKKEKNNNCYYCTKDDGFDLDPGTGVDTGSLSPIHKRVLKVISSNAGMTHDQILKSLDIKRRDATLVLQRLNELDLIWKIRTDNGVGYECISRENLKKAVYKRLLLRLVNDEMDEETFLKVKHRLDGLEADRPRKRKPTKAE